MTPLRLAIATFALACAPSRPDDSPGQPVDTDTPVDSAPVVDTDAGADTDGGGETADSFVPPPGPCDLGAAAYISATAYSDLQSAYTAAVDGDVVYICPGTWITNDSFEFTGRLTIAGHTGDPKDVTITSLTRDIPALRAISTIGTTPPVLEIRDLEFGGLARLIGQGPPFSAVAGSLLIDNTIVIGEGGISTEFFNDVTIANTSTNKINNIYTSTIRLMSTGSLISIYNSNLSESLFGNDLISIVRAIRFESHLTVNIHDTTFNDNLGVGGQLINLFLEGGSTSVNFDRVTFANNNGGTFLGGEWNSVGAISLFTRYNDAADVDVHITDCVFDNNQGDDAGVLRVNLNRDFGGSTTVDIRDTLIHRSSWSPGFELMAGFPGPELAGPAIRTDTGTQTTLTNVDFGVGPTENYALDLLHCPDYEGVISGYYERTTPTQFCP